MSIEELVLKCKYLLERDILHIQLVVPGPPPRSKRVRFDTTSKKPCPMGEVLNWQGNPPRTLASFNPLEILEWLQLNGMVQIKIVVKEDEQPGGEII